MYSIEIYHRQIYQKGIFLSCRVRLWGLGWFSAFGKYFNICAHATCGV